MREPPIHILLSDQELLDELLRRCHERIEEPVVSTYDIRLRDLLYEVGKLLLQRNLNNK
jgi:predicted house-cleaning noncanonical NTP pyrophosphatase (MazG superfamily)